MFICENCQKSFKNKTNLDYHLNKAKKKCMPLVIKTKITKDEIAEMDSSIPKKSRKERYLELLKDMYASGTIPIEKTDQMSTDQMPPQMSTDQMPPHILNQIPPHILNQIPPHILNQIPPHILNQIPPHMFNQMPPNMFNQMPPNMANQMPPNMANQMPPNMANQMPPPMKTFQKKNIKEQFLDKQILEENFYKTPLVCKYCEVICSNKKVLEQHQKEHEAGLLQTPNKECEKKEVSPLMKKKHRLIDLLFDVEDSVLNFGNFERSYFERDFQVQMCYFIFNDIEDDKLDFFLAVYEDITKRYYELKKHATELNIKYPSEFFEFKIVLNKLPFIEF